MFLTTPLLTPYEYDKPAIHAVIMFHLIFISQPVSQLVIC